MLQTLRLSDPCSDHDLAIRRLEKGVTVSAPKESTVITISYSARSPELAHDVVATITDVFLEEHLLLNHSAGALDFFSEQVEQLHRELLAAQAELRDRKNAFQLTSNASRQSILEKSKDALRQKLYELEQQESDLKSRYTDSYPPLREIRRQRAEAEDLLTDMPSDRPQATAAVQPTHALPASDNEQRRNLDSELQTVNNQEFELAQLELRVQLLEGKYRMHVEKLEQARVNDALERERISNVEVAQAATLVRRPDAPQKRLLFLLGLIVASAGAFGLAFLTESLDQTLRTTEQVEARLGLPVLLSLPLRKRRRRQSTSVSTVALNSNGTPETKGRDRQHHLALYGALVRQLMSHGRDGDKNGARGSRTIGVVGCDGTALHSQVATDLAMQAASSTSSPVLLIDADSYGRRITQRIQVNGVPGCHEVVAGAALAENCIQHPQVSNLAVMSSEGTNGAEIAAGAAVGLLEQLDEVRTKYDLVVVDLPPTHDSVESLPAAEGCHEIVLVVEAERTRIQAAQRAKVMLNRSGITIAGVVLVNRREQIPRWLYQWL